MLAHCVHAAVKLSHNARLHSKRHVVSCLLKNEKYES